MSYEIIPVCLSLSLFLFLSHSLYVTLSLSFYLSIYLTFSLSFSLSLSLSDILSFFSLVINADYTVSSTTGVTAQSISALVTNFTTSGAFTATLTSSFPDATVTTLSTPVGTYNLFVCLGNLFGMDKLFIFMIVFWFFFTFFFSASSSSYLLGTTVQSSPNVNSSQSSSSLNYDYLGFLVFLIIPIAIFFGCCRKEKKLYSISCSENENDSARTL